MQSYGTISSSSIPKRRSSGLVLVAAALLAVTLVCSVGYVMSHQSDYAIETLDDDPKSNPSYQAIDAMVTRIKSEIAKVPDRADPIIKALYASDREQVLALLQEVAKKATVDKADAQIQERRQVLEDMLQKIQRKIDAFHSKYASKESQVKQLLVSIGDDLSIAQKKMQ